MGGLPRVFGVSSQEAAAAIADAEHALRTAFVNVTDAERAGVNVTDLLNKLNEAGLTLNMAEAARALADSVAKNAVGMKGEAANRFSNVLSASIIGLLSASVFVVALLLMWLWFKRYYSSKFLEFRPEATR
jgi:hypothetical protein